MRNAKHLATPTCWSRSERILGFRAGDNKGEGTIRKRVLEYDIRNYDDEYHKNRDTLVMIHNLKHMTEKGIVINKVRNDCGFERHLLMICFGKQ